MKKVLSLILVLVMVAGMLPVAARATEEGVQGTAPVETTSVMEEAAAAETTVPAETQPETSAEEPLPDETLYENWIAQMPDTYHWYVTDETVTTTENVPIIEQDENGIYYARNEERTTTHTYKKLHEVYSNPVSTMSLVQEGNRYYFTTFEDLKEIAAMNFDSWTWVCYNSEEPLIIKEDITLNENIALALVGLDSTIIIPEGVTLKNKTTFNVYTLAVEGTLVNDGSISINEELTVSGQIQLNSNLYVNAGATVSGAENIIKNKDWLKVYWTHDIQNMSDLVNAVTFANNDTSDWMHQMDINTWETGGVTIDGSIAIPANAELSMYNNDGVTIAKGCTLILNCSSIFSSAPVTVEGTLVNNCDGFYVFSPITFTDNGSYSGTGKMYIPKDDEFSFWEEAVPGINAQNLYVSGAMWSDNYWVLQDVTGMTQLATLEDLQWNKIPVYDTDTVYLEDSIGNIAWKTPLPNQGNYSIKFYKNDENTPCITAGMWFGIPHYNQWICSWEFILGDPESGTYYFTVQSKAEGNEYYDSEIAVSDTWTYTKPSISLGNCSNLRWDGEFANWDAPSNEDENTNYIVEFYYAPTADAEPEMYGRTWGFSETSAHVWKEMFEYYGAGYGFFRVRAISRDITEIYNGVWSEMSEGAYFDPDNMSDPTEPTEPEETEPEETVPENACGENLTWEFDEETKILTITGFGDMFNFTASVQMRSADPMVPWAAWQADIKQVVLPEGLTSIGNNAFNGCENLTEITIPVSVITIGTSAFQSSGLSSITFEGDAPETIGENAFGNVTATVSYPEDNATWTSDVMQNYGGDITWDCDAHGYAYGDANHDGRINAKDSTLILQYSVGAINESLTFCQECAEVSGDGRFNAKDATLILQFSTGMLDKFPCEK